MRLGTSTGVSIFFYIIFYLYFIILLQYVINIFQFHRSGTSISIRSTSGLRPMTAVRGAGYTSSTRQTFDPLNMSSSAKGPAPPLENGKDVT